METNSHHPPQLHHANTFNERHHPLLMQDEKQTASLFANSKDNVKVVIRVRPLNDREKSKGIASHLI